MEESIGRASCCSVGLRVASAADRCSSCVMSNSSAARWPSNVSMRDSTMACAARCCSCCFCKITAIHRMLRIRLGTQPTSNLHIANALVKSLQRVPSLLLQLRHKLLICTALHTQLTLTALCMHAACPAGGVCGRAGSGGLRRRSGRWRVEHTLCRLQCTFQPLGSTNTWFQNLWWNTSETI